MNDDMEGEDDDEEEKAEASDSDDAENDIFAQARENKELKFANEGMIDKIKKIEDEMMDEKKWQMKGEIQGNDRNYNSLLEEYVDFDTASKLPP
jgi:U3 small nucleolar ribonucleoprotein component